MVTTEATAISLILLTAFGILAWGYRRSRPYGKLGLLSWFQSVLMMAPWIIFFGLVAAGIYLNLIGILVLFLLSVGGYIYLGKKVRAEGQDALLREKAAQRLQQQQAAESRTSEAGADTSSTPESPIVPDVLPIPQEDLKQIQSIFGIDTFFVTETIPYQEGAIFKGNLRGEPEVIYPQLSAKLTERFDEKYRLFLVEGTEGKPVFITLPSTNDPSSTTLATEKSGTCLAASNHCH